MNKFPLYDNMKKGVSKKDLKIKEKEDFIEKIKNIDHNGAELIYALITSYNMETSKSKKKLIPYQGEYDGKKISFDLEEFPLMLKQILYKFLNIHLKAMMERAERDLLIQ